jgi:hypothetical protein
MESDAETLAATALALHVRVEETKCLTQTFLYKIDLGAIDIHETFFIDHDPDSAVLENDIVLIDGIGVADNIGKTGTPGLFDTQSKAQALATILYVGTHAVGRRLCD